MRGEASEPRLNAAGRLAKAFLHTKTTPLLTIEEADAALKKSVPFRAPGR